MYSGYTRAKNIAENNLIANRAKNLKQPAPISILKTSLSHISLMSSLNLLKNSLIEKFDKSLGIFSEIYDSLLFI